jgi:hypothetical protein
MAEGGRMMAELSKAEREELARNLMDRFKDLQKYDLIKLVYESYSKGEFGDDPEIVAPSVLAFIGGVLVDDVSKVRKAMSSLKMEKFLSGLPSFKLEKLFSEKK